MYEVIIIGAGPAGASAALFAAHSKLKTLIISKEFNFKKEDLKSSGFLEVLEQEVVSIEKNFTSFQIETNSGNTLFGRSLVLATGKTNWDKDTHYNRLTNKNGKGEVMVNLNMETSIPGIFAAGSVNDTKGESILKAQGQGVQAVLSVRDFLENLR